MSTVYVVIDVGCHECGVASVPVGIYGTEAEAKEAERACNTETGGWRDGGQTFAVVFEMESPAGEGEPEEWESHEQAHRLERRGGDMVDRRVCQGIGCPYGDH